MTHARPTIPSGPYTSMPTRFHVRISSCFLLEKENLALSQGNDRFEM
jgi:hypothetical protein